MQTQANSWYSKGFEGNSKEQDRRDNRSRPDRFYLKDGQTKEGVFVDDIPVNLYEHNVKANGNWFNWTTCARGTIDVPPCCIILGEDSRYYVSMFTICDLTGYTNREGKEFKYQLKLYPAKFKVSEKLKGKRAASKDGFAARKVTIGRFGDNAPNTGDDFDFNDPADMAKLFTLATFQGKSLEELYAKADSNEQSMNWLKKKFQLTDDKGDLLVDKKGKLLRVIRPFNYFEIFKPMEEAELKAHCSQLRGYGGGNNSAPDLRTDEIPF